MTSWWANVSIEGTAYVPGVLRHAPDRERSRREAERDRCRRTGPQIHFLEGLELLQWLAGCYWEREVELHHFRACERAVVLQCERDSRAACLEC